MSCCLTHFSCVNSVVGLLFNYYMLCCGFNYNSWLWLLFNVELIKNRVLLDVGIGRHVFPANGLCAKIRLRSQSAQLLPHQRPSKQTDDIVSVIQRTPEKVKTEPPMMDCYDVLTCSLDLMTMTCSKPQPPCDQSIPVLGFKFRHLHVFLVCGV